MAMYPNGFCIKFDAPEGEDRQISFVNYLVRQLFSLYPYYLYDTFAGLAYGRLILN